MISLVFILALCAPWEPQILTWPVFKTYLHGPSQNWSDCCTWAVDQNADGKIDMLDMQILQATWTCQYEQCGKITMVNVEVPIP